MLHETLRDLRKKKSYSQEEAAARLNVVRQTVSKWEKGLSVPDADALVRLSELYEVTVGELLGAPPSTEKKDDPQPDMREIAEQLSRINEQLVIKNRRSSRIWKIVGGVVIGWGLMYVIVTVLSAALYSVRWQAVTNEESNVRIEDFSIWKTIHRFRNPIRHKAPVQSARTERTGDFLFCFIPAA